MPSINFFPEDIQFNLKKKNAIKKWIRNTIVAEGHKLNELTFIFCSDQYLLNINKSYLNHDTYTDIVTFDNSVKPGFINGDIFISIDRIHENSQKYKVSEVDELHRVMIHGVLHLLGYSDKTSGAKKTMTSKEDEYLRKREFIP